MKVAYIQWLDSVREDDGWHEYKPLTKEKLVCESVNKLLLNKIYYDKKTK